MENERVKGRQQGAEQIPSAAELWELLRAQQARIASLEAQLGQGAENAPSEGRTPEEQPAGQRRPRCLSRAGLLKAAAVGIAGVAGAEALSTIGSQSALAADPEYLGSDFKATGPTAGGSAFWTNSHSYTDGVSVSGQIYGVAGYAMDASGIPNNGAGVYGTSGSGAGVQGQSSYGSGVYGAGLPGVQGVATGGAALSGPANVGVYGEAGAGGAGVQGVCGNGIGVSGKCGNGSGMTALSSGVLGDSDGPPGVIGLSANSNGVQGASSGSGQSGVYGAGGSGAYGVTGRYGNGSGTTDNGVAGVWGDSDSVAGVIGTSANYIGVIAASASGEALSATGATYGADLTGGLAPLYLEPSQLGGAPSAAHNAGEVFVDQGGVLYYCLATGTPGTWKRMNATIPITPIRVLDTRNNTGGHSGSQPVGVKLTLTLAGNNGIPSQAVGVIGTLRAYNPAGAGYLTAFPGSGSPPTASNVNFYANPSYPGSYAVANEVTVGLSGGQMSIYVGGASGASTQIVFDLSGYLL